MKHFLAAIASLFLQPDGTEVEFVRSISDYANYSTVEWQDLRNKYYRPNTADWNKDVEAKFHENFPRELAAEWWHLLQNARTDFHHRSLPVRATASAKLIGVIEHTEALFDTLFVRCIEQEYYMRLLPEMYNEVMSPAIDKLTEVINQEY